MILVRGGTVLGPDGVIEVDLLVENGRITRMEPGLEESGAEVVDAAGCWVGPGLVDLHVHLREPGHEWKEDVRSGSAAAAAGGFTAIVAMPNTSPAIDAGHRADFVFHKGRSAGLCEVIPAGAITRGRSGEELANLDDLVGAGVRIFTDDGDTVADGGLLRRAMEYLSHRDCVVAQHAEDRGLAADGHMHEGAISSRLGIRGLPAIAEEAIVARDVSLAEMTGAAYHVQHVSTAGSVELVRRAKAAGLSVSAEVTPHHLALDHAEVLSMDPDYKMYPPLRTADDVAELRKALIEGTIDAVATDHAPHADHEQEVPFEEAPRGVIGLETAVGATLGATRLDQEVFFERMSIAPARIGRIGGHGLPVEVGGPANLVVIDPGSTWAPTSFVSRSRNSPFRGRELTGRPIATIYEGRITYQGER